MAGGSSGGQPEPRRGRHRRGGGGDTWTPSVPNSGPRRAHAKAPPTLSTEDTVILPPVRGPEATEPVTYSWPETPPTGLRKFDLGTIPASVTPPRTWRRAAWFAVATSACVVLGLGFAAYTLVGNPARQYTIDALPGQPTQQLVITELPAVDETDEAPSSTTPTTTSSSKTPRATRSRGTPAHPADPRSATPGQRGTPNGPPAPGGTTTTTPPPRNTVDPPSVPATDPEAMGDRTEQYYQHVTQNPEAAYALTTGQMRAEGVEGIEARYADVERIEVKEITIDPNWAFTRSMLTVVHKDGSTTTEERELTFSPGANPRISGDAPAA